MHLNIKPGSDLDLDEMDKPSRESPVLADTVPVNKSRLGVPSSLLPYSPTAAAFSSGWFSTLAMKNLIPRNLDDVLVSDWIDAMSSSSPPRKKHSKDFTNDPSSIEDLSEYKLWTSKYPSALTLFEHITSQAEGKKIALFLDYDGTLSPIVNDPDSAVMSKKMRAAVKSVAEYFPTAIISGRSRDKVYELVGLTELYYAGSHGMDIMGPVKNSAHQNCTRTTDRRGKESHLFQPATKFLPAINEVFRSLVDCTKGIKGAKVENNKFCVSVHYRLVDTKSWPVVMQIVQDVLNDHPNLRLTYGRKVLEIRPVIDWDKGKAVLFLLQSLRLTNPEDVLPIYIGDDRTDEDAFKVLKEKNHGCGILVSSVPKESRACYSLKDPSEVLVFLKSLVRWRRFSRQE